MIGRIQSRAVSPAVLLAAALVVPALVFPAPVVSGAAAAQCQGSPEIDYDIALDIDTP